MLKNKKLTGNFFALFTLYIANYVLPFLTIPYLSRLLTVEHYGLILYAMSFTLYFTMVCEYGFNFIGVKEVVLVREDKHKLNELFSAITAAKFILFLCSFLVAIIVLLLLPKFSQYWYIYIISMLGLLNNILFPTWFFRGMEQMWHITIIGALMKVISVVMILSLIHNDSQFVFIPVITTAAAIISGLVAQIIIYRRFNIRYVLPNINLIIEQFKKGWYIFISNLAISFYSTANAFFLGLLSTPLAVAFYVAAEKLVIASFDCIAILSQVLFPHIVKSFQEDADKTIKLLQRNFYFFIMVGICASLTLFFGSSFIVKLIFGLKYAPSIKVLQILSILPLIICMTNVLGSQTMIPMEMNKQYTIILILAGCLNLVMIFTFVPKYSYIGSAWSVVTTESVNLILMISFLYYKGIYIWLGKFKRRQV